ncbi:BatD family protein [Pseudoalteromonas xiamenensis]
MVMRFIGGLLLLALSQFSFAADGLTASVDKNPVLVGEYFTLTIEATGKVSGETPDTQELAKIFNVGPMSTSSRTSIINGSISSSTTWQMQVLARRAGEFTIPAFSVSGMTSEPITLNVIPRDQDDGTQNDVFVKVALQDGPLYVQQAALYTVKLYVGKELLDGQLTAPELADTQFTLLGKQKEEYEIVDGRRYFVVTREYLMQPNKSGQFTIDGPIFNGQVREGYRRLAISAVGESVALDVKPIPENFPGAWLPSELVHLGEEWKPTEDTVTVGTPITRTLTLTATGVTQEQLPEISVPQIDGFRTYPDDSERKQISRDGRIISQMVSSIALLPQKPGTFTLPELKVAWFNTKMGKTQYASVPARSITVIADPNAPKAPTLPEVQKTEPETPQIDTIPQQASMPTTMIQAEKSWQDWLLLVSGYVLWVLTLGWFLFKKPTPASAKVTSSTVTQSDPMVELNAAAKLGDTKRYYQALMSLTSKLGAATLSDWASKQNDASLSHEIANLQATLYSSNNQQVDLSTLHKLVCAALKQHANKGKVNGNSLETLY